MKAHSPTSNDQPEKLKLVGYDNPLGIFPSLVVPIVSDNKNEQYKAVFFDKDSKKIILEDIDIPNDQLDITRVEELNKDSKKKLDNFDYKTYRLFAKSEYDIDPYEIDNEKNFFSTLLQDKNLLELIDDPFVRLSLAKITENGDLIKEELKMGKDKLKDNEQLLKFWNNLGEEISESTSYIRKNPKILANIILFFSSFIGFIFSLIPYVIGLIETGTEIILSILLIPLLIFFSILLITFFYLLKRSKDSNDFTAYVN